MAKQAEKRPADLIERAERSYDEIVRHSLSPAVLWGKKLILVAEKEEVGFLDSDQLHHALAIGVLAIDHHHGRVGQAAGLGPQAGDLAQGVRLGHLALLFDFRLGKEGQPSAQNCMLEWRLLPIEAANLQS